MYASLSQIICQIHYKSSKENDSGAKCLGAIRAGEEGTEGFNTGPLQDRHSMYVDSILILVRESYPDMKRDAVMVFQG